ncbi:MAG: MFS transporter, partial [Paracoccaceae bacterium]|nr:MFS transporter [Paracoccaceae bacterium]
VGHVRVFAALGSFISAVLILFPTVTEPWAWILLRGIIGFSFCGVYITVESWLNDASTNETRGRSMSLYLIVQMAGIIAAQFILNLADPAGYLLFVIPSVLVSIAFAPILLTASPAPAFSTTKRMSLKNLYSASPLGCVAVFLLGGIFSALFGMAAVFGTEVGLSVRQISIFVAVIYTGGLLWQYPIGWASDRMDRRRLILGLAAVGAVTAGIVAFLSSLFPILLVAGFVIGGVANPLYSLAIAHTNDYLQPEDMASASAGLLFLNGVGAIGGPLAVGWMMGLIGPGGFFLFMAVLLAAMAGYAAWRMTRRPAMRLEDQGAYVPIAPTATTVAAATTIEALHEEGGEARTEGS